MTELLVGTKKGLFLLEGEPDSRFEITARAFAGQPVDFATRDPRSGRPLATVTSPFFGAEDLLHRRLIRTRSGSRPMALLCRRWRFGARADLGDRPGEADGTLYAGRTGIC